MRYYKSPEGEIFAVEHDNQITDLPRSYAEITTVERDAIIAAKVPPAAPPASVTMRQARLALLGAGVLSGVDAFIDGLPSPQKEAARIEWEYAATVERGSALVTALAVALTLDSAALDALFTAAAAL